MLAAWRALHQIHRDQAALHELPIAVLSSLTANLNRDSKRKPEPFKPDDFCCYRQDQKPEEAFPPVVGSVAMDLRAEGRAPKLLVACWPQILQAAKAQAPTPEVRAFASDDDTVWVLAPAWEGRNCRGALVLVQGRISGPITVRDIDRPLITHSFELPQREGFGWIEAGHLLKPPAT